MTERLLLFDIDATLLLTGGAGMRAMVQASHKVFGPSFSWEGISFSGGLDPILLREAARRSDLSITPRGERSFRSTYRETLAAELERSAPSVQALPGVHGLLRSLHGRGDVVLGLLTGNYGETAALKLVAAGIDPGWFEVSIFGDEAPTRPLMGALAPSKFHAARQRSIEPHRVVVIGDTPRDVDCARTNGFLAFAVGTGKFPREELLAAGAHVAVDDLSDPAPLIDILTAV